MKFILSLIFSALLFFELFGQPPEMNVIYGDNHIFTINTPTGWVNDKELASKIGIASFFYAQSDVDKNPKSYMYAMGYDKDQKNKDLKTFIQGDIANFKQKYPNLTYDEIRVEGAPPIIASRLLSYKDLDDRFGEEVLYMETDSSIIVLIFAAFTAEEFMKYQPAFDSFAGSFQYRGNDPKPFLEWQKNQR